MSSVPKLLSSVFQAESKKREEKEAQVQGPSHETRRGEAKGFSCLRIDFQITLSLSSIQE